MANINIRVHELEEAEDLTNIGYGLQNKISTHTVAGELGDVLWEVGYVVA